MAVIECVFNYDPKTGILYQEVHVLEIDSNDKINFVTQTAGLTLKCEAPFPPANLKKNDYAPVRYTRTKPKTKGVAEFNVYYHGPRAQFACGELNAGRKFQAWPKAVGQSSPGGSP